MMSMQIQKIFPFKLMCEQMQIAHIFHLVFKIFFYNCIMHFQGFPVLNF